MATLVTGLGGSAGFGEQSIKSLGVTSGNLDDGSRFVDTSSVFGASGINIGGTTYSGFHLNTNGNLTFTSPVISTAGPSNNLLADVPGQPMIAAFWTDIDVSKGGDIFWDLDPANGKVTITWSNAAAYSTTGTNSFQIVLSNQGSGNVGVDFIYGNIGYTAGGGTQATVGISNGSTQILAEGSGNAGFLSTYGNNNFDTGDPNGVFGADLQGGTPTVSINGTAGNDTLNGTTGSDLVYGGAGHDSINGGGGNDTLNGDAGNDTLNAGTGNDSLSGGDGDDRFVLANGFGNDTIIGGEGGETTGDVLDASAITANTTITFTANEAGTITDGSSTATFSQIENITTGSGNNTVSAAATTTGVNIDAGAGNDTMTGGSGADTLLGGAGNDILSGGAGNDVLAGGDGDDRFVLTSGFGNDTISGGESGEVSGDILDATAVTANTTITFSGNETGTITDGTSTTSFSQIEVIQTGSGNNTVNAGATTSGVNIDAGAGNDTMTGGSGADTLTGGIGNDSLNGGLGNDSLDGGTGNDTLAGGAGADSLTGGDGDDRFVLGNGFGNDTIVGGESGESTGDVLDASSGGTVSTITFTGNEAGTISDGTSTASFSQIEMIQTSQGSSEVNASATTIGVNVVSGSGQDTLIGGSGADTLAGGAGNDSIRGGVGNDSLDGGAGNDTLAGEAGADSLTGGDGDDRFVLGNSFGNDTIVGGEAGETSGDVLDASAITANTTITFTANEAGTISDGSSTATFSQIELIQTGSGNNTVNAGATTSGVNIDAGAGQDTIFGGSGSDTIYGGSGSDSVRAGAGADIIYGGDGDDVDLDGAAGNDQIFGGTGRDTIFSGQGEDLADGGIGNDTIYGSQGNDTLYGGDGNDLLSGETDNDLVYGGSGDDTALLLQSDLGNDTIFGGETGETSGDLINASNLTAATSVTFTGAEAGTITSGGATIQFSEIERLTLGSGSDTINASSATAANIDAGAGNDVMIGGSGADTLLGGAGNDSLDGGSGNDSLDGGDGDDRIDGGSGNDQLNGGSGNDTIKGGSGTDTLSGGAGADTFELVEADSGDTITDFSMALQDGRTLDQLDVSDLVDADGNPIRAWQIQVADNGAGSSILTFPGGETLTLQGITPDTLQSSGTLYTMGVPCFAQGMMIDCPSGPRPVEDLRPGDLVLTEGNGARPVVWVGKAEMSRRDLENRPDLKPILIPAGSAGNHADVLLSPQHAVALPGQDVMIRARHLVGLVQGVRVARGKATVTYHHFLLDCHAVLSCHGLRTESLYPGPMTERMFAIDQRLSLTLAITRLTGTSVVPTAGLAALYGPRCLPLLGRTKGDSLATALAVTIDRQP